MANWYVNTDIAFTYGTYNDMSISPVSKNLTITNGDFNEQVNLSNISGNIDIAGGRFTKNIKLTPIDSNSSVATIKLTGTNWYLNNLLVDISNGVADISNQLANGAIDLNYAVIKGM